MKRKYLSIITDFSTLEEAHLHNWEFFYKKVSKNFDKVYLINSFNIRFFPNLAAKIYSQNKNYKLSEKIERLPENFVLFDPKDEKDFAEFLKDKDLFVINNFGRHFWFLKIYNLLRKYKIKQVQISNYGAFGFGKIFQLNSFKNFIRFIVFHTLQTFFNKFTVLLSNFGIVPKLEIIFLSNKDHLLSIKKGKFSNFLHEKGLLFAKEIKLVNSRSYDIFLENKLTISEDYIVHLDANLNHSEEIELRGKSEPQKVKDHYYHLEKFLSKLSEVYKKEVKICIHPLYDLDEHQNYLKKFEVLKYVTRKYVYKSYIVTCFDSSAIIDAILLKKKIIGLESSYMSENEMEHSKIYPNRVGYLHLNTKKDFLFNPIELLNKMNSKIENYDKYISKYHCFEPNKYGSEEIIKTIKNRFF